jgi:hypothetical protein
MSVIRQVSQVARPDVNGPAAVLRLEVNAVICAAVHLFWWSAVGGCHGMGVNAVAA